MSRRGYDPVPIEQFGRFLITTGDLDPIYNALCQLMLPPWEWPQDKVKRWLVSYWCFYHAGVACWMSSFSGEGYWRVAADAASNVSISPAGSRWPRAKERRHFRGPAACEAVSQLRARYAVPETMVDSIIQVARCHEGRLDAVMEAVQEHHLFGPWIAFKAADMLERVLDVHIDFSSGALMMFRDPVEAAELLWRERSRVSPLAQPRDKAVMVTMVVSHLLHTFSDLQAPPRLDRPIGLQEVETVLCKWKSHVVGHYPQWNDIDEIREGLKPWGLVCESAHEFIRAMPGRP